MISLFFQFTIINLNTGLVNKYLKIKMFGFKASS